MYWHPSFHRSAAQRWSGYGKSIWGESANPARCNNMAGLVISAKPKWKVSHQQLFRLRLAGARFLAKAEHKPQLPQHYPCHPLLHPGLWHKPPPFPPTWLRMHRRQVMHPATVHTFAEVQHGGRGMAHGQAHLHTCIFHYLIYCKLKHCILFTVTLIQVIYKYHLLKKHMTKRKGKELKLQLTAVSACLGTFLPWGVILSSCGKTVTCFLLLLL